MVNMTCEGKSLSMVITLHDGKSCVIDCKAVGKEGGMLCNWLTTVLDSEQCLTCNISVQLFMRYTTASEFIV